MSGMRFDPTKPVQTRDGRKARILCVDHLGYTPIIALISASEDFEILYSFHGDGKCVGTSSLDLINIPETFKQDLWMNVYPRPLENTVSVDKETADRYAGRNRIACVKVTVEGVVGDGLGPLCDCLHSSKFHSKSCRYYKAEKD